MLDAIFLALVGMGAGFYVVSMLVVLFGVRRGKEATMPISVLKPLKEAGPELYDNLATFCRLDYPDYQLILGMSAESDPAFAVVQKIRADFPQTDMRIVVEPADSRSANIANMVRRAKHDIVFVSDDDVRVEPWFLKRMAAPFVEGQTGAATALYFARAGSPWHLLTINLETLPFGLIGKALGATVANGAGLGLRRSALDKIGGFEAAAEKAADNHWIVKNIEKSGFHVEVLTDLVEMRETSTFFSRQLRSDRTDRFLSPILTFCRVFTFGLFWALVYAAAGSPLWPLLGAAGLRLLNVWVIAAKLRSGRMILWSWLVPLRDLAALLIWLLSWFGRRVRFHGKEYRFEGGKRLRI
jgi:ceramide glucosyltransferase